MAAAAAGRLDWQHGYEALASVILQDQLTRSHAIAGRCSCFIPGLMRTGLLTCTPKVVALKEVYL